MKCNIKGCPGEYEARLLAQAFTKEGTVIVLRDIPAEVCDVCGDTLLDASVSQVMDEVLNSPGEPEEFVPAYSFPRP
mgnify:CR=1 FL=1